jgi:hypothetical protein
MTHELPSSGLSGQTEDPPQPGRLILARRTPGQAKFLRRIGRPQRRGGQSGIEITSADPHRHGIEHIRQVEFFRAPLHFARLPVADSCGTPPNAICYGTA